MPGDPVPLSQQAHDALLVRLAAAEASVATLTGEVTRLTARVRDIEKLCEAGKAEDEWPW